MNLMRGHQNALSKRVINGCAMFFHLKIKVKWNATH